MGTTVSPWATCEQVGPTAPRQDGQLTRARAEARTDGAVLQLQQRTLRFGGRMMRWRRWPGGCASGNDREDGCAHAVRAGHDARRTAAQFLSLATAVAIYFYVRPGRAPIRLIAFFIRI